jgi:cation diffusion facilitator family transporter
MAESRAAVYGAIAANTAIAITKFVAAAITGSSAMLSEGIHSVVDTGDGLLLLIGMKLSQRAATPEHPFGHGKELYFWSLIVGVLIFGIGGGVSAYEGVLHILHPHPVTNAAWNYGVIAIAAVFEGASLTFAVRQFARERGDRPFWDALHESKDPTTYTVMAEDTAALAGLAVAAAGIFLSERLGMPVLDGVASIVIGLILAGVAVALIWEARGLLIGEGVRPETAARIREIALSQPAVQGADRPVTMYLGPDNVLLALDVQFRERCSAREVASTVGAIERQVRGQFPRIRRIYIEARSIGDVRDRPQAPASAPSG